MKKSRVVALLSAVVLFSGTTLAITSARAQAQDASVFSGQQDDSKTSPDAKKPPLNIAGPWSGSLEDNLAGEGIIGVEFTETSNGILGGTWTFTFDEGVDFGTITGKAGSDSVDVTFVFAPKAPFLKCRFTAIDDKHVSTEISGNYHFKSCGPLTKKEHGSLQISPD